MDLFFVVLALLVLAFPIIAIVALVKSVGLGEQLRRVETRLAALERARAAPAPARAGAAGARTAARRRRTTPSPHADIRADGRAHCAGAGRAEQARAGNRRILARCAAAATRAGGGRGPAPGMSFEERLGTQWAVWVGGLALALGGIFLVRYSIEQGLLGPPRADRARRTAGGRAHRRRRMGAPERAARRPLRPADRAHPEHPDRRRHHRRLCRRLRRSCALRLSRSRLGFHPARPGGAGDACRRAAAWAGARRPRPRRRLCDAASRRFAAAGLLVALRLSGGGDRRRLRARALPHVALARHHRGRLQRGVDPGRDGRDRRERARRARLPCHRRLCARRKLDRGGAVARSRRTARPHRRRVIGGARRLPRRRDAARAHEPARSAGARDLRRARGGDRGDRLARGSGDRGGAGGGACSSRSCSRAGRPISISSAWSCRRVRSPVRCRNRRKRTSAGISCWESASRAVRQRRLSGAGTLGASRSCLCCGARRRCSRRSRFSPRSIIRIAGFEPSIPFAGGGVAAERALCVRDRDPGQARAAAGPCRGERDIRDRRGCRACARADHGAGERLAHRRARADGAGHRLGCGQAAAAGAARACRRDRRAGAGAHRLGAAHRRRRRGHDDRSSTGCSTATAFPPRRSGWAAICCAAAATTCPRAWWMPAPSC